MRQLRDDTHLLCVAYAVLPAMLPPLFCQYGPDPLSLRSQYSFKRPFFRRPTGFHSRGLSGVGADCRSH